MQRIAALAMTAVVGLTAAPAFAQDMAGVIRYDGPALRQRILADQIACRDWARKQGNGQGPTTYSESVLSTPDNVATDPRPMFFARSVNVCMEKRGFTPAEPSAEALAAYKAKGGDPYAELVQYELAPRQATTMVQDVQPDGRVVQTYTIGRF
jgi:hypothetical protein